MADDPDSTFGSWDPREIETILAAYRAILEEAGETGLLASLSNSVTSGRDFRRLVAKAVIRAAAAGVRTPQELVTHAVTSMMPFEVSAP